MGKNIAEKKKHASVRRRQPKENYGTADWEIANAELLRAVIAVVAGSGGALRLGYTRDGGAYAVGIYGDGDPYTDYVRPNEDLDEYLRKLGRDFEAITDERGTANGSKP